ncbi:MAG TPA: hypothetical protein VFP40_02590 [Terriglobales bacterium]|nr:hypothetical protein [Terriglobales bacterium]
MLEQTEKPAEIEETTTVAEGAEVKEQTDPEVDKEKAKRRLSDRLREQTYHRRQAERERDDLKKKVDELSARTVIKSEPDPEDYSDRGKYAEDREAWKAQERAKIKAEVTQEVHTSTERSRAQAQLEKQKDGYLASRVDAIKEDPKFHDYEKEIDKVVEAFDAPEIQDLILAASKQGPKIVKYLGTNPDELEEIASASPRERTFLMGKLVAKLEAKPVKTISTAPNPTRSEKGSAPRAAAPSGKSYDPSKESFRDYSKRINGFK